LAVAMALASTDATFALTSWAGPGCSGQTAAVESCGCSDLQFHQGQDVNQDQTVTFYTETGCAGARYGRPEDSKAPSFAATLGGAASTSIAEQWKIVLLIIQMIYPES
ncbi:hypothetical protein BAE44_0018270, partial [Dichanthelium oligosanthes]